MEKFLDELKEGIVDEIKRVKPERDYSPLDLKFNPFPPAGIPRLLLPPLDDEIKKTISMFIRSTYFARGKKGEYAGLTIIGDYGNGKTHLMRYIQSLLNKLNEEINEFSVITCFVDRPEDSPQRVVHRIVEEMGADSIRKHIWMILIGEFQKDPKGFYRRFGLQETLFKDTEKLFEEPVVSNYLKFLDIFHKTGGDPKLLQENAREIVRNRVVRDGTLADRYLDLIFSGKKADTSWDILAGYISSRDMPSKQVKFLSSIVKILHKEGFRQLYVFVDEFEDVSELKGVKLTNYLQTLNTLINQQRNWALIVSLTRDALIKIREESVPLYDRLTTYKVELQPLDKEKSIELVMNYLKISVTEGIKPSVTALFSEKSLDKILRISKGNYRSFIELAHKAIEYSVINEITLPINEGIIEKVQGKKSVG